MRRISIYEVLFSQTSGWRLQIEVSKGRTYFSLYWRDKEAPTHIRDYDNASTLAAFRDLVQALEKDQKGDTSS